MLINSFPFFGLLDSSWHEGIRPTSIDSRNRAVLLHRNNRGTACHAKEIAIVKAVWHSRPYCTVVKKVEFCQEKFALQSNVRIGCGNHFRENNFSWSSMQTWSSCNPYNVQAGTLCMWELCIILWQMTYSIDEIKIDWSCISLYQANARSFQIDFIWAKSATTFQQDFLVTMSSFCALSKEEAGRCDDVVHPTSMVDLVKIDFDLRLQYFLWLKYAIR